MKKIDIEVCKNIELVETILYLAHQQNKTYQSLNNTYYIQRIDQHFKDFERHEAVKITADLVENQNFVHGKPLRAALTIDAILTDANHILFHWARAVKDFERRADFQRFFDGNKDYYDMISEKMKSMVSDDWIRFIESYFKKQLGGYHIFICPIYGNNGFMLDVPVKSSAYVVTCEPRYDEKGTLSWVSKDFFAKGMAHEFGHCFVNPVVEKHIDLLEQIQPFFASHTNMPNFYNVDYAVMNEYFVRAYAIRFMEIFKKDFPGFDMEQELRLQRESFIYIDRFVELLKSYEKDGRNFENFYLSALKDIGKFLEKND